MIVTLNILVSVIHITIKFVSLTQVANFFIKSPGQFNVPYGIAMTKMDCFMLVIIIMVECKCFELILVSINFYSGTLILCTY